MKVQVLLPKIFNFSFTYNSNNIPLKIGDLVEIPFGQSNEIGVIWKNKNIELVKELIIRLHNQALLYFKQPLAKKLYAKCWVNIMRKGDKIKPHLHCTTPESYLGGHIFLDIKYVHLCPRITQE